MNSCIIKWNSESDNSSRNSIISSSENLSKLIETIKIIKSNTQKNYSNESLAVLLQLILSDNTNQLSNIAKANINFVKSNLETITKYQTEHILADCEFNFDQFDKLIPKLSSNLNEYIRQQLKNEIFKICYYNPESGFTNPNQLHSAIKTYKNNLFKILQNYTQSQQDNLLYPRGTDTINYDDYNNILQLTWIKLNQSLNGNSIYEAPINSQTESQLEIWKAVYILNNFDNFLNKMSNGLISIKSASMNNVEISPDKYTTFNQTKHESSYEGNHSDADSNKEFSKIFDTFWNTIPNGKNGYLSRYDFIQLTKFIQVDLNEDFKNSKWNFLINTDLSEEELVTAVINALQNDSVLQIRLSTSNGYAMCKNIANALKTAYDHLLAMRNRPRISSDEAKMLDNKMNFIQQFKSEVINHINSGYLQVDENNNTIVVSASRITMSKMPIIKSLERSLTTNLLNGNYYLYNPKRIYNYEGSYIYSQNFINYLKDITGISFTRESLDRFFADKAKLQTLFNFIDKLDNKVTLELIPSIRNNVNTVDKISTIQKFIQDLKFDSTYLDFSNIYIQDNRNSIIKITDLAGNTQPIQKNPNTIARVAQNLQDYQKQISPYTNKIDNVLIKYPQLIQSEKYQTDKVSKINPNKFIEHIVYRGDVAYQDGKKIKTLNAVELTPLESFYVAFNNEFFDSIIQQDTFYNQIDCYSDKVTVALAALNCNKNIQIEDNGIPTTLLEATNEQLKQLWIKQHKSYYNAVAEKIHRDLKAIFGTSTTLEDCIRQLENTKYSDFQELIKKAIVQNPTLTITEEIHYCKDKKSGYCRFNNTLYFNIKDGSVLESYFNLGLNELKSMISNIAIPKRFRTNAYIESNWQKMAQMFGLSAEETNKTNTINQLNQFFKPNNLGTEIYWLQDNNPLSDKILEKYYLLQAISTDAEQQITNKANVIHKSSIEQFKIDDPRCLDPEFHITEDEFVRRLVATKRNNAEVASYLPMSTTTKYGVGKTSKIMICESRNQRMQNYNGQVNKGQDVHDGELKTLGIAVNWENNSYPGKSISKVKKVIGLIPTLVGMEQFKCADYPLDNILLMNAFANADKTEAMNLETRARKMMRVCKITNTFFNNWKNNRRTLGEIYKYFGKEVYKASFELQNDNQVGVIWTNINDGTTIQSAPQMITNVEQLWDLLGNKYTIELKEGNWVPSNASMDVIANMISEFDPTMKETIISKMVDVSSNKSSVTNLNLIKDLDDPNNDVILTHQIDNNRWGQQQDYSHESDESKIPSLTQVLSALGLNGKNIDLIKSTYDTLARLTLLHANELKIQTNLSPENELKLYSKLVEKLLYSLTSTASRSDSVTQVRQAYDVIQNTLTSRSNDLEITIDGKVAFSAPDIFYKLASNFISDLNNSSIKQKYDGIAIIQNPSHQLIGLYEDHDGRVYTLFDLLNEGRELLSEQNPFITEEQILNVILNSERFAPKDILLNQIELEDVIQWSDPNTGQINRKRILNLDDLLEIENIAKANSAIQFKKLYNEQRNLKAPTLSFKVNGITQSFWFTDCVKQRYQAEQSGDQTKIYSTLAYYRANLQGLANEEQPYYYATYEDYLNDNKTNVSDVQYTPGEQIIPKVNKSAQHLGTATLAQIQKDITYFLSVATSKFVIKNNFVWSTDPEEDDKLYNVTVVRDKDELVYTDIKTQGTKINGNITINDNIYTFNDEYGNKICQVPSLDSEVYQVQTEAGQYYLIYDSTENLKRNLVRTLYNLKEVNAIYENPKDTDSYQISKYTKQDLNPYIDTTEDIDKELNKYAKKLYQSFMLSNYTISARIPSQSFQSFMANKTVAFTVEDENNGYVNLHQIWFTGSDFDINLLVYSQL